MKTHMLLPVLILLILAGCAAGAPTAGERWILESMTIAGSAIDLSDTNPLTLEFGSSTSVGGSSGCNSYFGELTFSGGSTVTPGVFGGTEMACDRGMDVEAAYLSALSRVDTYEYSKYALTLSADDGQTVLKYQLVQSEE